MWGLVRAQCLPVFSRSAENLDVLATLYKLLTRLTLNPNEPDELLLGKCVQWNLDLFRIFQKKSLFNFSIPFRRMLFITQSSIDSTAATYLTSILYSITNPVLSYK